MAIQGTYNVSGTSDTFLTFGSIDTASSHTSRRGDNTVRFLVLHSTAGFFKPSLQILQGLTGKVSAHYLIGCDLNGVNSDGVAYQLVDERLSAWHSGTGYINKTSIGIELVDNAKTKVVDYLSPSAYATLLFLVNDICDRHQIDKKFIDFSGGTFDTSSYVVRGVRTSNKASRCVWLQEHKTVSGLVFHRDIRDDRSDPVEFNANAFIEDVNSFDMEYYRYLLNLKKGNTNMTVTVPPEPTGEWKVIPNEKKATMVSSVAVMFAGEKNRKDRLSCSEFFDGLAMSQNGNSRSVPENEDKESENDDV